MALGATVGLVELLVEFHGALDSGHYNLTSSRSFLLRTLAIHASKWSTGDGNGQDELILSGTSFTLFLYNRNRLLIPDQRSLHLVGSHVHFLVPHK